jgi:hypothetical protein
MPFGREPLRKLLLHDPLARRQLPQGDLLFKYANDIRDS